MPQIRLAPARWSALVLALCLVGSGVWVWRALASRTLTAAEVLSTIPAATGPSLTDKAIAVWVERARQDPRSVLAWTNLGDTLMQKARETMDTAYYGRAAAAFEKSLEIDPTNVPGVTGLSWVHGSRHEFERSIEWARKALAIDSQSQAAYGLLGDAAVEMGDYELAFQHYQKMLDLRPDLSSYSRGAHLLYLTGDTRKATWLMQKAIAAGATHAENTAWCRAQLALMLWNTGALLQAEEVVTLGLARSPANYHLLTMSGRMKIARTDYEGAIDAYRRAIAAVPQHEAVAALADLYTLTGQHEQAKKQYALIEAIHAANRSNGVKGNLDLARFYADHDLSLSQALAMAEEEYRGRPNIFAADVLAWCYYKNGRYAEAKKMSEKALSYGTPDAGFLFHAGMIHDRLGNRGEAQRFLSRAMNLNSAFHPIHATTAAETLRRLGG